MTVPQMVMTFFGVVAIACFLITWLILSSEDINRTANRMVYKVSRWHEENCARTMDEDPDACPEWADEQKWRETCLK